MSEYTAQMVAFARYARSPPAMLVIAEIFAFGKIRKTMAAYGAGRA